MKFLKTKSRILVTHQIQYIQKADQVLILKDGKSIAYGTYEDLLHSGLDFVSFLKENTTEAKKESPSQPEEDIFTRPRALSKTSSLGAGSLGAGSLSEEIVERFEDPKIEEETKMMGSVNSRTYLKFIKAGAVTHLVILFLIFAFLAQLLYHGCDFWLSMWVNKEIKLRPDINDTEKNPVNRSEAEYNQNTTSSVGVKLDNSTNLIIYSGLIASLFVAALIRAFSFFIMFMKASVNLHNLSFYRVLQSPMSMFDNNPVGEQ